MWIPSGLVKLWNTSKKNAKHVNSFLINIYFLITLNLFKLPKELKLSTEEGYGSRLSVFELSENDFVSLALVSSGLAGSFMYSARSTLEKEKPGWGFGETHEDSSRNTSSSVHSVTVENVLISLVSVDFIFVWLEFTAFNIVCRSFPLLLIFCFWGRSFWRGINFWMWPGRADIFDSMASYWRSESIHCLVVGCCSFLWATLAMFRISFSVYEIEKKRMCLWNIPYRKKVKKFP